MVKILALILSSLLLISIGLVSASSQDVYSSISESSDKVSKTKIEGLLKEVGELLEEARQLVDQAENAGLDVKIYRDLLETAVSKYQEGIDFYNRRDYDKAFTTLIYVKTRVQIIIKALQGVVGEKPPVQFSRQEIKNKIESLKKKYEVLESAVSQLADKKTLDKMLKQALELISKAEEILDISSQAAYSLLDKAENILKQVEEASGVAQATITVSRTETVQSSTTIESNTQTIVTKPASTVALTSTLVSPVQEAENVTREGVNIELEKKDGEYRVIVEHVERLINYENGTVLVIREKIVTVGNKTVVSISKELVYGSNQSRNIGQVSVQREQNLVGAWFKLSQNTHPEIYKLDQVIEAEVVDFGKNRVKVRLKAPDNTSGRLFIIELSPELVDLENILGFNLTVNGESAILASSLLDLASGAYDQPVYLFIISSKGVQILLYLPHFSEYIVEINAVLQRILEVFHENLQKIFSSQITMYATIIATIILLASTAITIQQKRILKKIK